jgi:anti-sigma factor RsiW
MNRELHLDDERAQLLVDGQLPAAEAEQARRHLPGCARCGLLVESYRALAEALDGLPVPLPPADFTAGVLAAIDRRERAATRDRRLVVGILGALAAAAAVLVGWAGLATVAPALSRVGDVLAGAATGLHLAADVILPVLGALRLEIAATTAATGLLLLAALRRLSLRPAEAT